MTGVQTCALPICGRIGDPGSPTKVPRMFPPVMPEPGIIIDEGSVEASVAKLMQLIKD